MDIIILSGNPHDRVAMGFGGLLGQDYTPGLIFISDSHTPVIEIQCEFLMRKEN
jgi:hypothetical protein